MQTIRYEAPESLEGVLRVMGDNPRAMILAGGTDLLVQYRAGVRQPSVFVDVKRIPAMVAITAGEEGVSIGAAAPAAAVCAHPVVREWWPGLVDAAQLIGSTQIQWRGSLGGNLCNASPAADSTCALIVNGAVCVIEGPGGRRLVRAEAFCVAPGRTVLAPGEVLVSIRLPRPAAGAADAYLRLIPRSEMDIAVASAGVSLVLGADGICTAARVAIGAVGPTALVVPAAAEALVGSRVDAAALAHAAEAARAAARPIDDKRGTAAYRRTVVGVLTRRAAAIAADRAKGR